VKHFLNLLAFLFWHILLDVAYDNRLAETEDWEYTLLILFIFIKFLSPVHTGNEVKFNTVDFVETATNRQQSWTFNFVADLFGSNLNIHESRDDQSLVMTSQ